jgi:hypothetical protein
MTATAPGGTAPVRAAAAVVGAALVLALAGGVLAAWSVIDRTPTVTGEQPFPGAWDASASFGPVRVERVERAADDRFAGGHHTAEERIDELRVSLELRNRQPDEQSAYFLSAAQVYAILELADAVRASKAR